MLSFLYTIPTDSVSECCALPLPCPDTVWESSNNVLLTASEHQSGHSRVFSYAICNSDIFGIFLPLSRILGEILDYHFLRQPSTFNNEKAFLHTSRENLERNLSRWLDSLPAHVGPTFCELSQPGNDILAPKLYPKVAYCGLHLYHCMHVLLYGQIDLVCMYEDLTWQASPDFIKTGEHAMSCANVTKYIVVVDPYLDLMYRYFGTYLLQSSSIFLILVQKVGPMSDRLILDNCTINLKVLDLFARVTNMDYQRTFAGILRKALLNNVPPDSLAENSRAEERSAVSGNPQQPLDPELLRYR